MYSSHFVGEEPKNEGGKMVWFKCFNKCPPFCSCAVVQHFLGSYRSMLRVEIAFVCLSSAPAAEFPHGCYLSPYLSSCTWWSASLVLGIQGVLPEICCVQRPELGPVHLNSWWAGLLLLKYCL